MISQGDQSKVKSMSAISDNTQSKIENLKIGNYIIKNTIGNGAFGKVHLGIHVPTAEKVAIKILQKSRITQKDIPRVKRQIQILSKLHHPCIVKLYEVMENSKNIFMIMQYIPNGELFKHIVNHKKLAQEESCKIFQQIINAIQYFHTCGVAHRDLKPENILIDEDLRIKIIDFGLSNTYQPGCKLSTLCGSPCYICPQMIEAKGSYDPLKVDIWSSGIILYTMLCGCLPFCDDSPKKVYEKIKSGYFKVPKTLTTQAKNLLSKILTINPSKRINIQQIKSHKWWERSIEYKVYGIVPEKHCTPIQSLIIDKMKQKGFDQENLRLSLKKNILNSDTSSYYILLKKYVKEGGISSCFLSSKYFNPLLLQETQYEMDSLDSNDLSDNLGIIPRPSQGPQPQDDNCQNQDLLDEFLKKQTLELTKQFISMLNIFKVPEQVNSRKFKTLQNKKSLKAQVQKKKIQKLPKLPTIQKNPQQNSWKHNLDKTYKCTKNLRRKLQFYERKDRQTTSEREQIKKIVRLNEDNSTIIVINKGIMNIGIPPIAQKSKKKQKKINNTQELY